MCIRDSLRRRREPCTIGKINALFTKAYTLVIYKACTEVTHQNRQPVYPPRVLTVNHKFRQYIIILLRSLTRANCEIQILSVGSIKTLQMHRIT